MYTERSFVRINMKFIVYFVSVVTVFPVVYSTDRGSQCLTPNAEQARCVQLSACPIIRNAIYTDSEVILQFLKASQCGYDTEPLVCCGAYSTYAKRNSPCITPDRKTSTCIGISECQSIRNTIAIQNMYALEFARATQCGYDTEPLVCCGSTNFQSEVGSSCVSDYNEPTTCIQADLCPRLTILATQERQEFTEKLHCGFHNSTQLVCCNTKVQPKLLPLSMVSKSKLESSNDCGYQETPKILGGTATDIGEFPWMALLRYRYRNGSDAGFRCGGTLIHNRYVLTAAHCIALKASSKFSLYSVRLGEWQISTEADCYNTTNNHTECADPVVDVVVQKEIPHPQFDRTTMFHDIALLQLQDDVAFTANIRPICLPSSPHAVPPLEMDTKLHLSGWGATENSSSSDIKLKVQVPIIPTNTCLGMVFGVNITDHQICAGAAGMDSCKGDSGGPIMRVVENSIEGNRWFQEGIISWGVRCGIVGVYTRMTSYVNWINENIPETDETVLTEHRNGVLFVN